MAALRAQHGRCFTRAEHGCCSLMRSFVLELRRIRASWSRAQDRSHSLEWGSFGHELLRGRVSWELRATSKTEFVVVLVVFRALRADDHLWLLEAPTLQKCPTPSGPKDRRPFPPCRLSVCLDGFGPDSSASAAPRRALEAGMPPWGQLRLSSRPNMNSHLEMRSAT